MAHACNPSYSGGRDQDHSWSQPRQIVQETLSRKNPTEKRVSGVAQDVGPEFRPQYYKKKKKKKEKATCIPMYSAALFMIANLWNQPMCPRTNEWIKKILHIYIYIYIIFYRTCMELPQWNPFILLMYTNSKIQ
jgi:hypothetical protein